MSRVDPFPPALRLTEDAGGCLTGPAATCLVAAFATLPENWRRAIWYSDMQGLHPSDAGQLLQMGPELFAAVLHEAQTALRASFAVVRMQASGTGNAPSA